MKLTPETISGKIGRKIDINTIEELSLDGLGITEVSSFTKFKSLKKLDLSSNRLQLVRHIKGLFDLPVIESLNLTSNPVTKQQNYRITVIKNLPTLLILDEKQITGVERNQAREFDESNVTKDPLSRKAALDDEEDDKEDNSTIVNDQNSVDKVETTKVQQRNDDQDNEKEEQKKKLDEDSLFGTKTHKKLVFEDDEEISLDSISLSSLEKKKVEKKPAAKSTLLFEDDGDDIFAGIKKPAATSTKKSIADFDDDLFGDGSKDSKENLSSDFDISSYIQSNKNRGKSSLFD